MKRLWAAGGLLLFVALVFGACSDGASGGGGFSAGGAPAHRGACHPYTSCATCTPIVGCGWCYLADGTGKCAVDPDDCPGTAFSWTWEPTGCHVAAEAGVNAIEGGPLVSDAKAGDRDAGQGETGAEAAPGDVAGEANDAASGEGASETGAPAMDAAPEAAPGSDAASSE
jgi:hypothetical protein